MCLQVRKTEKSDVMGNCPAPFCMYMTEWMMLWGINQTPLLVNHLVLLSKAKGPTFSFPNKEFTNLFGWYCMFFGGVLTHEPVKNRSGQHTSK